MPEDCQIFQLRIGHRNEKLFRCQIDLQRPDSVIGDSLQ